MTEKLEPKPLTKLYGEIAARCFIHAHVEGEAQYAVMMHDVDEAFKSLDSRAPVVAPQGDEADNERKIAVRYLVKQGFVRCDQPEHGCDGWHERLTT